MRGRLGQEVVMDTGVDVALLWLNPEFTWVEYVGHAFRRACAARCKARASPHVLGAWSLQVNSGVRR
jgi:hypothetical protein